MPRGLEKWKKSRNHNFSRQGRPRRKLIDELFAIDVKGREEKMNHARRHLLSKEHAPALLAELHRRILTAEARVLPKSTAGKVARYRLALWDKLTRFEAGVSKTGGLA